MKQANITSSKNSTYTVPILNWTFHSYCWFVFASATDPARVGSKVEGRLARLPQIQR